MRSLVWFSRSSTAIAELLLVFFARKTHISPKDPKTHAIAAFKASVALAVSIITAGNGTDSFLDMSAAAR